jgi:hypothetical protein
MKWITNKRISHQPSARAGEPLWNVYEKDFDVSDPNRKLSDDEPLFRLIRAAYQNCTICGTQQTQNGLAINDRFWIKSATYPELSEGARSCSFCEILRTVLERCLGPNTEMLAKLGFVDWGPDPFNPVWYGTDGALHLEIFCTTGKFFDRFMICILFSLTVTQRMNDLLGYLYPSKKELSPILPAWNL